MGQDIDWAGVPFLAVFHHDGHFFRAPGLYGFVRNLCGVRTLLFVDHTDNIAVATEGHRLWGEVIRLGCNELHINTKTEGPHRSTGAARPHHQTLRALVGRAGGSRRAYWALGSIGRSQVGDKRLG